MFWIGAFWSRLFVLFRSFHPSCWSSSWGEYMLPLKDIWMIWRCSCCSMDRPRVFTTWALPPRRCHKRNVTSKKQPSTIFMLLVSRLDVMAVPCHKPHQAITAPPRIHSHLCVRCVRNAPALDPALVGLSWNRYTSNSWRLMNTKTHKQTLLFCIVLQGLLMWFGYSVLWNLTFPLVNQRWSRMPWNADTRKSLQAKRDHVVLEIDLLQCLRFYSRWYEWEHWIEPGLKQ